MVVHRVICSDSVSRSAAMQAVLKQEVNLGDLHAIHDGLDCSTFTVMAKSRNQRQRGNAWCAAPRETSIDKSVSGPPLLEALCRHRAISHSVLQVFSRAFCQVRHIEGGVRD